MPNPDKHPIKFAKKSKKLPLLLTNATTCNISVKAPKIMPINNIAVRYLAGNLGAPRYLDVLFIKRYTKTAYKNKCTILSGLNHCQKLPTSGRTFPGIPDNAIIKKDHKKTGQKFFSII